MSTLHRAKVVRVSNSGVFIEIPSLNPGYEYGPCTVSAPFELSAGRSVLVGCVDDIPDDPVIIGPLLSSYIPDPAIGIRSFPDRAARDNELPAPSALTFAWIDNDQTLDVRSWRAVRTRLRCPVDWTAHEHRIYYLPDGAEPCSCAAPLSRSARPRLGRSSRHGADHGTGATRVGRPTMTVH